MSRSVATQLMFEGEAEEAMSLYVTLFNGAITSVERYGPRGYGAEGSIGRATFVLGGYHLACIGSPAKHAFAFTPPAPLFVERANEAEQDPAPVRPY